VLEQFAERGLLLGYLLYRRLDSPADAQSRAFGVGTGPAIAAADSDATSDLAVVKFDFTFDLIGALVVTAVALVFEHFLQLVQTSLVFAFGLRIEHFTGIARQPALNREADLQSLFRSDYSFRRRITPGTGQQVERMKLLTRILQKPLNVAEALYVLDWESDSTQADRPIVAASSEYADLKRVPSRLNA
jgi:hypothetical protein